MSPRPAGASCRGPRGKEPGTELREHELLESLGQMFPCEWLRQSARGPAW